MCVSNAWVGNFAPWEAILILYLSVNESKVGVVKAGVYMPTLFNCVLSFYRQINVSNGL